MASIKLVSCKIGTVPAMVQIWRNTTPIEGGKLKVRLEGRTRWDWIFVTVDKVNPDGYFFASR